MKAYDVMKMSAVIGLTLLSAMQAFASSEDEVQIPKDATVLYQVDYTHSSTDKADVVTAIAKEIQEKESRIDVEFKCQAVYYKWTYDSQTKCDFSFGIVGGCYNPLNYAFGRAEAYIQRSASVSAYCAPRSYDQKIILSLERRCEENPSAECLDEKVKSAIATIQHTAHYDIDKPE